MNERGLGSFGPAGSSVGMRCNVSLVEVLMYCRHPFNHI